MRKFNNNFIGHVTNTSLKFSGSDNEDRFKENLKTQSPDWYYRDIEITYDYNENGHRCKNISEIDLDNYLLFSGCSHTEGTGLELEKTFPYLVSNALGMDYYNLSMGGSGIDVMTYNLVAWINTVKKPPKAVVIVWSYETRFVLVNDDNVTLNHVAGPYNDISRFMALGQQTGYFASKKELSKRMTKLCYSDSTVIDMDVIDHQKFDLARDLMHSGNMSNKIMAKQILDRLAEATKLEENDAV